MSNWDFRNLNLSGYDLQKGGALPIGPNVAKVTDAKMQDTRDGMSGQLVIQLDGLNGEGQVRDYITLFTKKTDDKAKQAVEIGRSRLKTLLHFAGVSTDLPGDVKNLIGLVVGVHVEKGEPYTDEKGVQKEGFNRPRRKGQAYFDPADLGAARADTSKFSAPLNDDIPF
jgi:hypothetical protein